MLLLMKSCATNNDINRIMALIRSCGGKTVIIHGADPVVLSIQGIHSAALPALEKKLKALAGVAKIMVVNEDKPALCAKNSPCQPSALPAWYPGNKKMFTVIAGPCAVEDEESFIATALALKQAGAHALRAGLFKPRTSPYSFPGLGKEGLAIIAKAGKITGLPIIAEAMDSASLNIIGDAVDVIQIGARNMQNFSLLHEAGRQKKPVLLKRSSSANITEWLLAAEHIAASGNCRIILCERGGHSSVENDCNGIDLSIIAAIKEKSRLPVIVDPSHGTRRRERVLPMARAAMAAGADGIMVEAHLIPQKAVSDARQTISLPRFGELMHILKRLAPVLDLRL